MGANGKNANESKKNSFYVTIDGKAVALTDEQRKAWPSTSMIRESKPNGTKASGAAHPSGR